MIFWCWDPVGGGRDEGFSVEANTPIEAAERFAHEDYAENGEGYAEGEPVCVEDGDGDTSRYLVAFVDQPTSWRERTESGALLRAIAILDSGRWHGWTTRDEWEDVLGGVKHIWHIDGPEPFGGIRANDEDHARRLVMMLNILHGLEEPTDAKPATETSPTADSLAEAMAELSGVTVTASGFSVTVCGQTKVEGADD